MSTDVISSIKLHCFVYWFREMLFTDGVLFVDPDYFEKEGIEDKIGTEL